MSKNDKIEGVEGGEVPREPARSAKTAAEQPSDVDAIRSERDDYLERLKRARADFDNYRKRVERERREWKEQMLADLVGDLLPILDDFERALSALTEKQGESEWTQGIEMIHGEITRYLRSRGVEPIAPEGEPFDPAISEAVFQEEREDAPDKTVLSVVRRGYRIGDRIVRPAQVVIARVPADSNAPSPSGDASGPKNETADSDHERD